MMLRWDCFFFLFFFQNEHSGCQQQDINGLVQDGNNSIANALELLQSCTKPLIYIYTYVINNALIPYYSVGPLKPLLIYSKIQHSSPIEMRYME